MADILEQVFGQSKIIKYLMFQHYIGNLSRSDVISYLEEQFKYSENNSTFKVIQIFDHFNKNKLNWLFVGFLMTPRVKLFNIQCAFFKKIDEQLDMIVVGSIFTIQLVLQTSLILIFIKEFSWILFFEIFIIQGILFFLTVLVMSFYFMARDFSDRY